MVLKVCFAHLLQSPRPLLGVEQSQTTLITILRHSCLLHGVDICNGGWNCWHLMLASRQVPRCYILHCYISIHSKPNQQKAQFYIKMSWWIKVIFIKSQSSSRCLLNILCDKIGNTHKAWQNAHLKENTCMSCESIKAVQPAFFMQCYFCLKEWVM